MKPQRDDLYKKLFTIYQKLKKHINASDICMSLGNLYLNKFDIENARKAFITALYLIPENDYNHWKIGLVMHNLGQYDLGLIRYLLINIVVIK